MFHILSKVNLRLPYHRYINRIKFYSPVRTLEMLFGMAFCTSYDFEANKYETCNLQASWWKGYVAMKGGACEHVVRVVHLNFNGNDVDVLAYVRVSLYVMKHSNYTFRATQFQYFITRISIFSFALFTRVFAVWGLYRVYHNCLF